MSVWNDSIRAGLNEYGWKELPHGRKIPSGAEIPDGYGGWERVGDCYPKLVGKRYRGTSGQCPVRVRDGVFRPVVHRPLLHRTQVLGRGKEMPPPDRAMPFVRVHPRPSDPLDVRRTLASLPRLPVREIGKEGA